MLILLLHSDGAIEGQEHAGRLERICRGSLGYSAGIISMVEAVSRSTVEVVAVASSYGATIVGWR